MLPVPLPQLLRDGYRQPKPNDNASRYLKWSLHIPAHPEPILPARYQANAEKFYRTKHDCARNLQYSRHVQPNKAFHFRTQIQTSALPATSVWREIRQTDSPAMALVDRIDQQPAVPESSETSRYRANIHLFPGPTFREIDYNRTVSANYSYFSPVYFFPPASDPQWIQRPNQKPE